jgi:hypothetical protein
LFHIQKEYTSREIESKLEAGIDKKKLVHLKFNVKDAEKALSWNEKREFEFKGHMYDVVSSSVHGDSVIFICYKDHKETRLNEEKERLIAKAIGQDPSRKNHSEKLTDFFKALYSQDLCSFILASPLTSNLQFSILSLQFSSFTIPPLSPPPKRG